MQVVMNTCFFLILKKTLAQIYRVVFEKNVPLIPKNDVTNYGFRKPETVL